MGATCTDIIAGGAQCTVLGGDVALPTPTPPLSTMYVNPCAPLDTRIDPTLGNVRMVAMPMLGVGEDTTDDARPSMGADLILYQLDCNCTADILMFKNADLVAVDFR